LLKTLFDIIKLLFAPLHHFHIWEDVYKNLSGKRHIQRCTRQDCNTYRKWDYYIGFGQDWVYNSGWTHY